MWPGDKTDSAVCYLSRHAPGGAQGLRFKGTRVIMGFLSIDTRARRREDVGRFFNMTYQPDASKPPVLVIYNENR